MIAPFLRTEKELFRPPPLQLPQAVELFSLPWGQHLADLVCGLSHQRLDPRP